MKKKTAFALEKHAFATKKLAFAIKKHAFATKKLAFAVRSLPSDDRSKP